jgi:NADH-quinone oxidoreductase subunit N
VISLYYYFGVVRAIYWSPSAGDSSPIRISRSIQLSLYACIIGIIYLGLFPNGLVRWTTKAAEATKVISFTRPSQ